MASPLELASYVQGQFNQGRERRDTNRLASLASQAYGADTGQQRELVGQAIATNPDAGFALGQNLGSDRNSRVQQLSQMARMLVSYKESGNEAGVQGLYPRIAQEAQAVGLGQGIPEQWDDSYLPGMQQLASIGGAASGNTVQSRFVADDGRVMMVMRDGTVTDSGQKADRQMWFRDHPGMDPQLVGKDGSVMPVGQSQQPGGNQLATTQAVVPQRYAPPTQGQHPNVEQVLAQANAAARAGVPQEQVEAWIQQQLSQAPQPAQAPAQTIGQMPAAMPASAPVGGALPPPLDYTGGGLARPSEAQTAAEVEMAKQRAQLAALPQELAMRTEDAITRESGVGQAKAATEKAAGRSKARLSLDQATARISRVDTLVESIMPRINRMTAGWAGEKLSGIAGTEAADLKRDIGTLQAIAGFDELNAMRAASPTGGALGNVTERELAFLQSVVRNIENSQSPDQLRRNLAEFQQELKGSWERVQRAYDQDYGGQSPESAPAQRLRFNPATGRIE